MRTDPGKPGTTGVFNVDGSGDCAGAANTPIVFVVVVVAVVVVGAVEGSAALGWAEINGGAEGGCSAEGFGVFDAISDLTAAGLMGGGKLPKRSAPQRPQYFMVALANGVPHSVQNDDIDDDDDDTVAANPVEALTVDGFFTSLPL